MKVLVTGGAGFIGSNLVLTLLNQPEISQIIILDALTYAGNLQNLGKIDPNRCKIIIGDITNGQLVESLVAEVDLVYHLAAETHVTRSIYDNLQFFRTDVLGTHSVANSILRQNTKRLRPIPLVHISTSEVYGTALYPRMDEQHPLNPCSPYAAAKLGADRLVYSYGCTYRLPSIILRPFNQYGPRQHPEKLIARFITSSLANEPMPIHGDGSASRDWTHVHDTVEFLATLIHRDLTGFYAEEFNIGSDISTSILEISSIIGSCIPDSRCCMIEERPGQVLRHTANSDKARAVLGWNPKLRLVDSIPDVIKWYASNTHIWQDLSLVKSVELELLPGVIIHQ